MLKKTFLILVIIFNLNATIGDDGADQLKEGNLTLAGSQQPGPLLGFGQNIIDKNDKLFYYYMDYVKLQNQKNVDYMPGFLYGITDNLSIFFNIPIEWDKKRIQTTNKTTFPSFSAQLEYAFFTQQKYTWQQQATIVTALSGPNSSMIKQVISNRKNSTFFLGGTYNYTAINWFFYAALGNLFSIKTKNNSKQGDNFLYQFGIEKNLYYNSDTIISVLLETLGTKAKQNLENKVIDANSGCDIIFLAPSLWISTEELIFQLGASWPVYQKLMGTQNQYKYQIACNIGWKL